MKRITYKETKERFRYDPRTGIVLGPYNKPIKAANVYTPYGKMEKTHAIWLWMTGKVPKKGHFIDHINRDRSDNRWVNLREATPHQSSCNTVKFNPLLPGVHKRKDGTSFQFQIQTKGKRYYFGRFKTAKAAHAAYIAASRTLHGEYSPWTPRSSSNP